MFVVFEVCQSGGVFLVHSEEVGDASHKEDRIEKALEKHKIVVNPRG